MRYQFDEGFPLIGVYGYESVGRESSTINQIGFYTLDEECASNTPEEVEDNTTDEINEVANEEEENTHILE